MIRKPAHSQKIENSLQHWKIKYFFAKEINMMSITYWADKDIIFSSKKS